MTALPLADLSSAIHGLSGHSSVLDGFMSFAAQYLLYAVVLVLAVLWFRPDGLRAVLAAGLGALLAVGLAALIGDLHYSARPFVAEHFTPLFAHPDDASFPSDHLCALGGAVGGIWTSSRRLAGVTALLAALVAVARVYAGVHHVTDVVAGFLIGVACGLLVWHAIRPALRPVHRVDAQLQRHRLRPRTG